MKARESTKRMGMKPYYPLQAEEHAGQPGEHGYAVPGRSCRYNVETMVERQSILAFGAGSITKIVIPSENRIERTDNVKEVASILIGLMR